MGGNSPLEKEELVAKIEKGLGSKEEEEEEGRVKKREELGGGSLVWMGLGGTWDCKREEFGGDKEWSERERFRDSLRRGLGGL